MQPGGDPFANLLDEARQELGYRGQQMETEEPHKALLELSRVAGRPVLLVLDQAEELFIGRSEEQSRELAAGLAREINSCLSAGQGVVHFLVCLRDDYFGHLTYLRQAGLPGIFDHELILPPLDPSSARLALEEPLSLAGKSLAPGLAQTVIEDLSGEGQEVNPVELELVSDSLFRAAEDSAEIGTDLYQRKSAGKVLAEYLGQVLTKLEQEHLPEAWTVLKQMVTTAGTSKEASGVDELAAATGLPEETIDYMVQRLVTERLVQATEVRDQEDEPRYRIAHDLVAREVLARMDDDERRDLRLSEELRVLTGHWVQAGRPKWWYPVPPKVRQELLAWQTRGGKGATATENAFLAALAQWDRRARLVRRGAPVAAGVLVVAAVVFGLVYRQQAREAEAQAAETQAELFLERDPGKAMAWILEAARLRGGLQHEPAEHYHRHWLMAREAWEKGLGWVVAQHDSEVVSVAFSPPGSCERCWGQVKLLASAGKDGEVRILDLAQGGPAQVLPGGHEAQATQVAFSPDGRLLASAGMDGTVRVQEWNGEHWEQLRVLRPRQGRSAFTHLLFSPDGELLAAGAITNALVVWSTADWAVRVDTVRGATVKDMAFSLTDPRVLACGFVDGAVARVEVPRTGRTTELDRVLGPDQTGFGIVQSLAFAPEGGLLAVGGSNRSGDHLLLVPSSFNLSGQEKRLNPGGGTVNDLAFAPDGSFLVSGDWEGQVVRWLPGPGRHEWRREGVMANHRGVVIHLEVSRDGRWILSSGDDGTVRLTYFRGMWSRTLRGHTGRVVTSAFSPDGLLVASGGLDGQVRLWSAASGRPGFLHAGRPVRTVAANEPERLVAAGLLNGQVVTWRDLTPESQPLHDHSRPVRGICLREGDEVVSAGEDGALWLGSPSGAARVLDATEPIASLLCLPDGGFITGHEQSIRTWAAGAERGEVLGRHEGVVMDLALARGGHVLVSGSADRTVALWAPETRQLSDELEVGSRVYSVAVLGDREVLIGAEDGSVRRWPIGTDQQSPLGPAHGGAVWGLAVSQNGRLLASASGDGNVRLWWPETNEWRDLRGHVGSVGDVTFSTDGRTLVSGGYDFTVRLWPLPPTDRAELEEWLRARSPWRIEDGELVPNEFPGLTEEFLDLPGEPPPAAPSDAVELPRRAPQATTPDAASQEGPPANSPLERCREWERRGILAESRRRRVSS